MKPIPAAPGIYTITNKQTGFVYIGASKNVRLRINAHRRALLAKTHSNKQLQEEFTASPDTFTFDIGELVTDLADLQATENKFIAEHVGKCYNRRPTSNMRTSTARELDLNIYSEFHKWRILLFARLGTMDRHILKTLKDDLQATIDRIETLPI